MTQLITLRAHGLVIVLATLTLATEAMSQLAPVAQVSVANAPASAEAAQILDRTLSVRLERVSLGDALRVVAGKAGVGLSFSPSEVPVATRVSLVADRITLRDALNALLQGTGLEIAVTRRGRIVVRPPTGDAAPNALPTAPQATGTITGHVTDGALKTPLAEVSVRVEGTALRTAGNADGKYTITGVASGTYRVTARRVGYQSLTKEITIAGDQAAATLDFALAAAPTRLDEVVTTAVGEQRRYQVGNDISTINADSIAPTAPITSLTDLISARAPGVTVLETSGMTGSGEAIRIEGLTSLVLQNDPILIVDGVRQDNSAGGDVGAYFLGSGSHPTPTRLNDIDFNDIATIDILKGPAAATEYGTDAANGVIVITTKHGTSGAPVWNVSAEQTESQIPESFSQGYYSWGHTADGSGTPVNCRLVALYPQYGQYASTAGNCVVDSVTQWNPLDHAATSIFTTGDRGKYDLSVGGGSDAVRYFVAGGLTNETGVIQMPQVFRQLADTANLGLPSTSLNPNSEQQRSVRVNTAIRLGPTADLSATGSYLSTYQQTPDAAALYNGVFTAPALGGLAHYYGYGGFNGSIPGLTPLGELTAMGSQNTDRVTGGLTANWHPAPWLAGHATVGLDHGSQTNEELNYPLGNSSYDPYGASLGLVDLTTDAYTADVRGSATAALTQAIRAVTSVGVQMWDQRTEGQSAQSRDVTATNLTLNGAAGATVGQQAIRSATLGGYGEEELSVADRVFVIGALRIDAGSGFGGAYAVAAYPKASVSWLALDRGATTVRLRGAFGESGVQPNTGAALQLYTPTVFYYGGVPSSGYGLIWPGNPDLQPERTSEFEGGVDVGGWNNRLSLAVTAYSKTTNDALVNVNPGELGGTYEENIGEVRNTGLEGSATLGIFQGRTVTWVVGVNASVNHNKLISLAPGVLSQNASNFFFYGLQQEQKPGYSLYGWWGQRLTYGDANHDGIIEPDEVTTSDSTTYIGPSVPTQEVSVSTHLGLWRDAVMLGGLVDYRGGYKIANLVSEQADNVGRTLQANDPTAPLWLQARAVGNLSSLNPLDVEDGSFVRVREVSLTYTVPRHIVRLLRTRSLSVTGAVRNLALWTRYTGVDPEASNPYYANIQAVSGAASSSAVNNDVRGDYGAVPLLRYWVVRLNAGL